MFPVDKRVLIWLDTIHNRLPYLRDIGTSHVHYEDLLLHPLRLSQTGEKSSVSLEFLVYEN